MVLLFGTTEYVYLVFSIKWLATKNVEIFYDIQKKKEE